MPIIRHFKSLFAILITIFTISFTYTAAAEGFIKKEVYSFKDKSGNTVFTDRIPAKEQPYNKQVIEAANSTGDTEKDYRSEAYYAPKSYPQNQTIKIVVEQNSVAKNKNYKKKKSSKRCKSYKKKLSYYSDKMKSGYKNSEYKKLESNRKKYRKLLFNNCDTKTFHD